MMKRNSTTAPLAILLLLVTLPTAFAKVPTRRVTISGGGLTRTIEITDARVLATSNVYHGTFLDNSRGPVENRPPRVRTVYEVAFHVPGSSTGTYVVFYAPVASGQGYIYLPGEGERWYYPNVGTILRPGKDGKWNYASPAWEELVKPLIARAEAAAAKH